MQPILIDLDETLGDDRAATAGALAAFLRAHESQLDLAEPAALFHSRGRGRSSLLAG